MNGSSMSPFNIRSLNGYLDYFLNDEIYSTYSNILYIAETKIIYSPAKHINEILNDWKDTHKNTQHGLALCYNVSKVNIEIIDIPSVLEVFPVVLEI